MRGYLLILCAALLWGTIGPVARRAFVEGVSPMEVAFWRAILAWIFFAIHAGIQRRLRLKAKDIPLLVFFAFTGVTLFYSSYQIAVKTGGAALASVLLYTAPAWVGILSPIFLKEKMTAGKITALIFTLLGVIAISLGAGSSQVRVTLVSVGCGLLAGFSYSLYYILGKHFSSRYSSATLFSYILPLGAAGLLPWVEFGHKTPVAWLCMLSLSFLSTYGAYFCYYAALNYLEPTRAAITATLEPVIASIVAYFWWQEYFSPLGYLGSALILGGVFIVILQGNQKITAS